MTNAASGRVLALAVAAILTPMAAARVWTSVYRCDERTLLVPADPNHPNVYPDIMVGTRLVIVVSSDAGGYWWGGLLMSPEDWWYGTSSGRGWSGPTAMSRPRTPAIPPEALRPLSRPAPGGLGCPPKVARPRHAL